MAVQQTQVTPLPDRRKPTDASQVYSQVVERYARLFDNPGARLRFLNNTLAKQNLRQQELRQSLKRYKFLENTPIYEWIMEARLYSSILEELRAQSVHVPTHQRARLEDVDIPLKARVVFFCQRFRHVFLTAGLVAAGVLLFGVYSLVMWSGNKVSAFFANKPETTATQPTGEKSGEPPAPNSPTSTSGLLNRYPENVWLISSSAESEEYSNGGRILRTYETTNRPRSYYLIPRNSESGGNQIRHEPIGIVYHTTENELGEFTADNNGSIQQQSTNILSFVRRQRSYHYVIDRFGRIHRMLPDNQAGNHAGHSIWADDKYIYVGLNDSFIGISFEATVTAGETVKMMTQAQVFAGKQLTDILRSKYKFADANCTTHGLISVDPTTGTIAAHYDWAKNFPFEAMGLSDKYQIKPAYITDYGFTWDETVLAKIGNELWPGALAADAEFKQRAERAHISVDALRLKLRERYKEQYARQKAMQGQPVTLH
ncbi:MAG: N-acetylmuramoyl-L-alanine amidase [Acidobacteria bacterium]|nr:N-acetylmuramoyl-L-alanine amidase [Acidobacteriota bacterium]